MADVPLSQLLGGSGSGSVSSVGLVAPTGFTVSGSPVTTTGDLTFSYTAGYAGYTTAEQTKLAGIAAGAEVNVNADWAAGSGDALILNKPTLGTVAALSYPGGTTLYLRADGTWVAPPASGGTVTSVDITSTTGLTASGGPIIGAGSLTYTLSPNLQAWSAITTASKYDSSNPSGYITSAALTPYVLKAGDTMSGALTTPALNTAQINPILTQGFQFVWNSLSAGSGRTEFLNNRGLGVGGFEWWDRANTGMGPDPVLMTLDSTAGNLAMRGAVTPGFAVAGAKKLSVITIGTAAPGALADGTLYLRY